MDSVRFVDLLTELALDTRIGNMRNQAYLDVSLVLGDLVWPGVAAESQRWEQQQQNKAKPRHFLPGLPPEVS